MLVADSNYSNSYNKKRYLVYRFVEGAFHSLSITFFINGKNSKYVRLEVNTKFQLNFLFQSRKLCVHHQDSGEKNFVIKQVPQLVSKFDRESETLTRSDVTKLCQIILFLWSVDQHGDEP